MPIRDADHDERGDTLVEILIALAVIALTSVALLSAFGTSFSASAEHKDQATLESVLKTFVEQATVQLGRQVTTTLTTQINNGSTGITTLNVNSIPSALGNGDTLQLFSNGLTQNVTVNGAQAASATPTTITVSSFTASSTFPVGSVVTFVNTVHFTACATPTNYAALATSVTTPQGTYTASIQNNPTSVQYWQSGGGWGSSCNAAATPSQQELLTATATSPSGATSTVQFVVTDPNFNPAPAAPPAFSGLFSDTVVAGVPSSFSVSASGSPAPALSASGQPSWAILVDNGGGNGAVYFNAPSSAIGHSFSFTISASNSYNGVTTKNQNFTVTVSQPPSITSPNYDTVQPGVAMASFNVTTTGASPISLSQTGKPSWASFNDNGNGTATLGGTPPLLGSGTYTFTIGAQNAASSVSQTFTLLVAATPAAPVFATAATDTVPFNEAFSFAISAAGSPSPNITSIGGLPIGVTFTPGTGSASLSGTPTTVGSFPITLTATNIAGSVTQNFMLTVNPQSTPAITSPTSASPACGQVSSTFQFTVVGTAFQSGATVTSTGMTGTVIVIVVDSQHLTVVGTGSSSTGTYSMTVTNPDANSSGGKVTRSGAIQIVSGQC